MIIGAAAGRYHSVFFTQNEVYSCGLNAGHLGNTNFVYVNLTCLIHRKGSTNMLDGWLQYSGPQSSCQCSRGHEVGLGGRASNIDKVT